MRAIPAGLAMKLIQRNDDEAEELGFRLRHSSIKDMRRRRSVFGLFLAAAASMSVVALYQIGILKHVPGPRNPQLDSDAVTGSATAYSLIETPDSVLAIGSYAATLALVAMGSPNRARRQPLIPLALAAKVGLDAVVAAKYTLDEWKRHRTFCLLCLVACAATFASVPLVVPEARRALRNLL